MKHTLLLFTSIFMGSLAAFAENHDEHDHKGHDHHNHAKKEAGPNGGRMLIAIEPHAEFFVTEDRKIQITFLNDDKKVIPPAEQTITMICGDRIKPTKMVFLKEEKRIISENVLPKGNKISAILRIKPTKNAKTVTIRLVLNLAQCPTCEFKEYACTCDHAH